MDFYRMTVKNEKTLLKVPRTISEDNQTTKVEIWAKRGKLEAECIKYYSRQEWTAEEMEQDQMENGKRDNDLYQG